MSTLPAPTTVEQVGRRGRARAARGRLTALGWIGAIVTVAILLLALIGPWLAPHDPDSLVGLPYGQPTDGYPFGFDFLGRDSFSRFLAGGRTAVILAVLGYMIGATIGLALGLLAAFWRGRVDTGINWGTEVMIGFPSLVLMMLLVAGLGSDLWVVVVSLAAVNVPRIARLVRAAALDVRDAAYVEVAEARGERRLYIMLREILPGVMPPFLVDAGIRIPASILLVASLSFLGLGIQPPAADWGLIISENRSALTIQPWTVVGPIAALALLMIGVNLALDGMRRGRSDVLRRRVD